MDLKAAIAEKLSTVPARELQKAFDELSTAYRNHSPQKVASRSDDALILAYVAARMPATHQVVKNVLVEYTALLGSAPLSLLDIGAGPATASFAALELFNLKRITLIEKEPRFQRLAKELATLTGEQTLLSATWLLKDLTALQDFQEVDVAIASYSLSELEINKALQVASRAFASVQGGLIVIEPGTPQGFERILSIRDHLLSQGAHVAAPCPHAKPCPMRGEDFCHFSARVERASYHRSAKSASLPYEDEKFSYVILTKNPISSVEGRIVKRPMRGSGHITLDLCQDGALVRKVVARSQKEVYKIARKAEWGDRWP